MSHALLERLIRIALPLLPVARRPRPRLAPIPVRASYRPNPPGVIR